MLEIRPEADGSVAPATQRFRSWSFSGTPAKAYGVRAPRNVPDEAWMALRLPSCRAEARGLVSCPQAFEAVA